VLSCALNERPTERVFTTTIRHAQQIAES